MLIILSSKLRHTNAFYLSPELKDGKQTICISKYRKLLMMLFITEELAEQMIPRIYTFVDNERKNVCVLLCCFLRLIHRSTNINLST